MQKQKYRTKEQKSKMSIYEYFDFNLPSALCSLVHLALSLGDKSLAWAAVVFNLAERRHGLYKSPFVSEGV